MSEWDCDSIEPLSGVPRVRILDEGGRELFTGYYIYRLKRQICPFGDRVHPDDVDHLVAVENEADWNLPRRMTIKKVTPPHRIELIEPEERTCRNIANETDREFGIPFICSECGANPHDAESYYCGFSGGEYDWRFCPNCGARVTHDA